MYKSCSRCGKIHPSNYKCDHNRQKVDWDRYNNSDEYKLRNTYEWHKKSEEIRERSRYLCEVCEDKGIYNYKDIEVHHIEKLSENKEGLLDNYNLICLCKAHHKLADNGMIDKDYLYKLAKGRECKDTPVGNGM